MYGLLGLHKNEVCSGIDIKSKGEIKLKENKAKCPFYSYDSQSKICCFGAVYKSKSTTLFLIHRRTKKITSTIFVEATAGEAVRLLKQSAKT